ncbi:MAG: dinitrogenase iron-molybdenum cofactor biosynthesis protein [Oscillospiraceae bacterium]|nr:dinitrogenase iron-molybdenum cofactor biosynthesis protein [Oscillospiraceae bacterium]
MKVAVTYENGQIFQHFGHTQQFKVYEIEDGKIVSSAVVDTNGSGHGALAGFLSSGKVDALICGGIGGGAKMALAQAGIQLFGGCSGSADAAAEAFAEGKLSFNPDVMCNHHGDHHHDCGSHDHDCGSHDHHCGGHGNHCHH